MSNTSALDVRPPGLCSGGVAHDPPGAGGHGGVRFRRFDDAGLEAAEHRPPGRLHEPSLAAVGYDLVDLDAGAPRFAFAHPHVAGQLLTGHGRVSSSRSQRITMRSGGLTTS